MVFLASYKGTHRGWHGLVNIAIRWLDRSRYSHTELCFDHPFEGEVDCYSSSGIDGGVRCKRMKLNPDKWDITPLPWLDADAVYAHYLRTAYAGYDYWGTGRFAVPWLMREHPTRWFCSEWAAAAMGIAEPWRLSPGGLRVIAQRLEEGTP